MLWPALLLLLPGGQGVRIYKCCSLDQRLDPGGECVSTPGAEWLPLVYSPGKKGFLPQGETPALWEVEAGHLPSCSEPLAAHQDSPELPALLMFENGSLWLHESGGLVEPGLFCVDSGAALVCPSHPAVPGSVRKCCGEDAAWSESKGSCVSWSQGALNLSGPVVAGFPPCHGPQMGYVVSPLPDHLPASDYCVEYVLDQGPSLVTCDVPATDHQLRFSLYPAGLLVSCVFLAATLAAGCLLPASHHAIHWRCQTCHVACLLAGYLLLAIVQLGGHNAPPLLCSTLAIAMHFSFLAAFFWLNTMCFNIWWTFRDFRPSSLDKLQEVCRLRLYQVYAWGVPLIIAGVAALVDNLPPSHNSLLRPRFGQRTCWFYGDMEILAYFFAPLGLLLLINLFLFAATAWELTCGLWKTEVVKASTERAALGRVCVKLVIMMGLTWVLDIVSWAVGGPSYLWYLPDLLNTLQGVFIFIVVGCHPQVWAAVKRNCLGERTNRTLARHQLSSVSQASRSALDTTNTTKIIPLETMC